jgi:hypothetical protein
MLLIAALAEATPGISEITTMGPSFWLRVLEISPSIAVLFAVIFLLYRLLVAKDKVIADLVAAGQGDIERQSKMITLLEVLVNGAGGGLRRKGGG